MTNLIWGVYPYVVFTLFFVVPVIRMVFRPYSFTTRASGLFGHRLQGLAMHLFHWGIFAVFFGHVAGFVGGGLGLDAWVYLAFYWLALIDCELEDVARAVHVLARTSKWLPKPVDILGEMSRQRMSNRDTSGPEAEPYVPSPAEIVGLPPALEIDDSDLVGEAEESSLALEGVEVDDTELRRGQLLEQINETIKTSPEEAANLVRRWAKAEV